MNLPAQRLLVFLALCTAFGAAVWFLDAEDSSPRALLAAVGEPTIDEGKCVAECTKENGEKFQCGKSVTIDKSGLQESSKSNPDVKAGTCRTTYKGKDGKDVTVDENDRGRLVDELGREIRIASKPGPVDASNKGVPAPATESPYQTGPTLPGSPAPTPAPPPSTPPATPPAASSPSPATQIGNIANTGGQTSGSPAGASRPTFSPSPALTSGSPFNLGSLFGGGGSGSGGGYAGQGGTIAYVPVNQYPGLTSSNFDTRGTGVTFPQPQRV